VTPAWFAKVLPPFACASVGAALAARVLRRGPYYPGWDVVGAANGLHLVSTRSAADLLRYYEFAHVDPTLAWNVFGIPVALLPGALASWWPWEFWPHLVTPCLVALSLALLSRALQVWTIGLLAIGASPAFLSYTVSGFPYVSGVLPYALALWIVFRWQRSLLGTALLGALVVAASRHVQELGRLSFVVFLAAALLLPDARRAARVVWIAIGATLLWLAIQYPSANTLRYGAMTLPPIAELPAHVGRLALHFAAARPDLPFLLVAGLLAALAAGRERWFWSSLLFCQLGLLLMLTANTGSLQGVAGVWPRRVLVLDFLCAAACVALMRRPGGVRWLVVLLLVVGNLWQLAETAAWASRPWDAQTRGWGYVLPYTHTPLGADVPIERAPHLDSRVSRFVVDWSQEMRAEVTAGRRLILVYNLTSYDENASDPAGIIDRLYLGLGHAAFMRSVFVFGDQRIRVNELPIHRLAELQPFVASMNAPSTFRGYWLYHPLDDSQWAAAGTHREEVTTMFRALAKRFVIRWDETTRDRNGRALHRFSLEEPAH
jgi:hypothetical protein